ncbi:MAG: choice-of-anchor Q domain-containing protein [Dokdonella sp.]
MKTSRHALSLHPLAACLALAFGVLDAGAVPPRTAVVVQNCLDHGAGSLRQAIIDDTTSTPIDLTQLSCSGITLTTGSLYVQRAQLIKGPGAAAFTISGANLDRVFTQTSAQPLALYGMTIRNGYSQSGGGCVYSAGTLQLNDTVVSNCRSFDLGSSSTLKGGGVLVHDTLLAINSAIVDNKVYSALGIAIGGGAAVGGTALLDHSTISRNVVSSASGNLAMSGGIDVTGTLNMMASTVSDNRSSGVPGAPGVVGGARALYGATIMQSTISGNSAEGGIGGLSLYASTSTPIQVTESTISGNSASATSGLAARGALAITNSTIAFNVETGPSNRGAVHISYSFADIESTIIAANVSANGQAQNVGLGLSGSITGAHNLLGSSPSVTLPPGTIGGDPMLLPLHANGGPTKTHALRPGSPAVNAGSNAGGYPNDQRDTGYPRVIGPFADIGAFEGVEADSIFYSGFD